MSDDGQKHTTVCQEHTSMSDDELRDKLASEFTWPKWPKKADHDRPERYDTMMNYEIGYEVCEAFEAGWNAARVNSPKPPAYLGDCADVGKERDHALEMFRQRTNEIEQLRAEVERLTKMNIAQRTYFDEVTYERDQFRVELNSCKETLGLKAKEWVQSFEERDRLKRQVEVMKEALQEIVNNGLSPSVDVYAIEALDKVAKLEEEND